MITGTSVDSGGDHRRLDLGDQLGRDVGQAVVAPGMNRDLAQDLVMGAVERGERNLSLYNIWRLAYGLEVTAADLMQELPARKGRR